MAKRFTDTDKWKKPFIKSLPVEYKLFYLYLLDECDNAGIWHVEIDLAEMRLGIKLSTQKIRGFFKERIVEFDNESKWFIPDFICFQYGNLDEKNRAHKSVIDKLSKYDLLKNKGHTSPLQGAKDKDMDKDKEEGVKINSEIYSSNLFRKPKIPTKDDVWRFFQDHGGTKEMAKRFWEKHNATGWFLGGSPIVNVSSLVSSYVSTWKKNEESKSKPYETASTAPSLKPL